MFSDDEIREMLTELDESEDVDVSQWEAEFLESVLFRYTGPLTQQQRSKAIEILEEYGVIDG